MQEHSKAAWGIASRYSNILASETRDLARHIDAAIAIERERCAQLAERLHEKPGWSPHYKNASAAIADLIRRDPGQPLQVRQK